MKRAILTVVLVLTSFACAASPQVEPPVSVDGQESTEVAGERVAPRMLNPQEVNRALLREYPARLKDRGVGGTTVVHIFIDVEGIVRNQLVAKSSGHGGLDAAALIAIRVARFSPAMVDGEKTEIWISIELSFSPRQVSRTDGTQQERAG